MALVEDMAVVEDTTVGEDTTIVGEDTTTVAVATLARVRLLAAATPGRGPLRADVTIGGMTTAGTTAEMTAGTTATVVVMIVDAHHLVVLRVPVGIIEPGF